VTDVKQLMTPDEAIDYLTEMGKMSIGGDSYIPSVITQNLAAEVSVAALAVDGDPCEYLPIVFREVIVNDPLYFASFTVDSYKADWGRERMEAERAKGPIVLQEHFEAGDPNVHECLMVYAVFLNEGRTLFRGLSMPYRRTDDDIVWLESKRLDDTMQGRIPNILRLAVAYSNGLTLT
jgi:hypothetical protein